eukprot:453316-Rhodomonas_salina.1
MLLPVLPSLVSSGPPPGCSVPWQWRSATPQPTSEFCLSSRCRVVVTERPFQVRHETHQVLPRRGSLPPSRSPASPKVFGASRSAPGPLHQCQRARTTCGAGMNIGHKACQQRMSHRAQTCQELAVDLNIASDELWKQCGVPAAYRPDHLAASIHAAPLTGSTSNMSLLCPICSPVAFLFLQHTGLM